jgi:integrase
LEAIKEGRFTVGEVFSAHRTERLGFLAADMVLHRGLWPVVQEWCATSTAKLRTMLRYETSFKALRRKQLLPENAKVLDLGKVAWGELQERWQNSPADWNHLRRAVSRFLTVILEDRYHPFRRKLLDRFPKAIEPPGRVPDITPELFWKVVGASPEHVRPSYVTLVGLGLRVSEYLACRREHLRPHTMTLLVPGTKTDQSEDVARIDPRLWPWVDAAIPAPVRDRWLRTHWVRACAAVGLADVRLHDLRHCSGQWLTEAGRPEASVQQTLRHKDPAMTRRYTKQRSKGEDARVIGGILFPEGPRLGAIGA